MEICLDGRSVRQIRLSAADAIEEGDNETLREDILGAFTDEQVEEIERRIDSGDFGDFVSEILDEWSGEDVDELFELIESQLSDVGIDVKYELIDGDDEETEDEEVGDEDEELTLVDDEDEDEEEEEAEEIE